MNEPIRHNWKPSEVAKLFDLSFNDLLFRAHQCHRLHHNPNHIQISTLLSVKTGRCPEDCAYCPQSIHYKTGIETEKLLPLEEVKVAAQRAKDAGAERFCIGAAWREPTDRNLDHIIEIIKTIKDIGLETCATLGMLTGAKAKRLADSGLDYYNHNLDTSPEFYPTVITTRTYQDRLDTLEHVRNADLKVCCGGILGMGEARDDRIGLLLNLANLPEHPESVPINMLVQVEGTPLHKQIPALDPLEFVRTIAVSRILMPKSWVRLSAGREDMSDEVQALCFFAGANSVFYGEKLLTTSNPDTQADIALFKRLGLSGRNLPDSLPDSISQ